LEYEQIRQYLPHFVYELMKSGATPSTINSFRGRWNTLPAGASELPCPLCYATGRQGSLQPARNAGAAIVQCARCRKEFIVGRH
jgi:hypothetical protein